MKPRRYVLFISKGRNGHGLLSVFAPSPKLARERGKAVIGKRPYTVGDVWSFRKYAASVRWFAVNEFIANHTKV